MVILKIGIFGFVLAKTQQREGIGGKKPFAQKEARVLFSALLELKSK